MMAPHWLDDVIGKKRTVDEVAQSVCSSPDFRVSCSKGLTTGCGKRKPSVKTRN